LFIQFLVEDQSGEKLIDAVMEKYKLEKPDVMIDYQIKSYKGIGGLKKGPDAKNIKSTDYRIIVIQSNFRRLTVVCTSILLGQRRGSDVCEKITAAYQLLQNFVR
jgi:hypothetical protein